ncbi:hypothetical protein KI387_008127, partial [Taxus chinensis]
EEDGEEKYRKEDEEKNDEEEVEDQGKGISEEVSTTNEGTPSITKEKVEKATKREV